VLYADKRCPGRLHIGVLGANKYPIISLDAYGGIAHINLGALILREPSVHKLGRDSPVRYVVRWVVQIYLQRPTSHLDEVAERRCPW